MRNLAIDVETTKAPNIFPWQKKSVLVSLGIADESGWRKSWYFNHEEDQLFAVTRFPARTGGDEEIKIERYEDQRTMIDEIQAHILTAQRLVGHNLKFDLNWLRHLGLIFDHCKLWCTQVVEYLLRGQRIGQLSLADLSKQYLNIVKIDKVKTFWDAGYETTEIPLDILIPYLEQDCINALAVFQKQAPLVTEEKMNALAAVQCECSRVLSHIETNGMRIDREIAAAYTAELLAALEKIDAELNELFGFEVNLSSNDELSAALYGGQVKRKGTETVERQLKDGTIKTYERKCVKITEQPGAGFLPPPNSELKKQGYYKTDKGTIKFLKATSPKQKRVKELLEERSGQFKALSTLSGSHPDAMKGLIEKIQSDGCVHGNYNQTVAKTGRLTCKEPNLQNLPVEGTSKVKTCFIPRFDFILAVDLSQIEWRVAAYLSQDAVMMKEILAGVDPHTENAIHIFGADPNGDPKKFKYIRKIAKIVTFRLLYGGGAYSFYMDQKMPNWSLRRWESIVEDFYNKYKGLKAWQDKNIRTVWLTQGLLVNPTGRKFIFRKGDKGYRPQQIKNFPVQSFATADIMPLGMVIFYRKFLAAGFESLIIGQVHDSLLFDCKEDEMQAIAKLAINTFRELPRYLKEMFDIDFNLPIEADAEYGTSYGDMEELPLAA